MRVDIRCSLPSAVFEGCQDVAVVVHCSDLVNEIRDKTQNLTANALQNVDVGNDTIDGDREDEHRDHSCVIECRHGQTIIRIGVRRLHVEAN